MRVIVDVAIAERTLRALAAPPVVPHPSCRRSRPSSTSRRRKANAQAARTQIALRDVQEAASHADPRTTMRCGPARQSLDRHATYLVAAFVAGAAR